MTSGDPQPAKGSDDSRIPRVVLLCGGLGMRLREETEHKPKALVEVGGHPILWHIMRHYGRHGFNRFVICLGYKGERIREYFLNYEYLNHDVTVSFGRGERRIEVHASSGGDAPGRALDWEVTLVDTGQHSMTGARLKRVERYIDTQRFLCTYGDGVSDVDLSALVRFHEGHGKVATITGVAPISRFGALVTDCDKVVEVAEKPELTDALINGGFFCFDRRIFDFLSGEDGCVLEQGPLSRLAAEGELMAFRHRGYWRCVDTPRDLHQLNEDWKNDPQWVR